MLNRYEVGDWIARGGMSNVFHGIDTIGEHNSCVLKIASTQNDSKWLTQEGNLLSVLKHTGIVSLLDHGNHNDGRAVLVLKHVQGLSFKEVLQRGAWKVEDLTQWFFEICEALTAAHKLGIIHGDLKPSNIMVRSSTNSICLLDFGLHAPERLRTALADKKAVLGSPRLIAPEHIRGETLDRRTDVYGVGVLLYRTITGAYPFQGHTKVETLAAHLFQSMPPFSEKAIKPILTPQLEPVVTRCLMKDPADRYESVQELYSALVASLTS
jgi:serine/threonine-protein kinase